MTTERQLTTPKGTAVVFVFDGFADWEPASALAELRRSFGFSVQVMATGSNPVTSMGGLKVVPDLALGDFHPEEAAIVVLPAAMPGWRARSPRFRRYCARWLQPAVRWRGFAPQLWRWLTQDCWTIAGTLATAQVSLQNTWRVTVEVRFTRLRQLYPIEASFRPTEWRPSLSPPRFFGCSRPIARLKLQTTRPRTRGD